MNCRQYERTVQNRCSYDARPLFAGQEVAGLLRRTARGVARSAAAAGAWERVMPPDILAATRVEAFERGALVIAVADAATAHYLRQEAGRLRQRLTPLLPALRELRFQTGGSSEMRAQA